MITVEKLIRRINFLRLDYVMLLRGRQVFKNQKFSIRDSYPYVHSRINFEHMLIPYANLLPTR